MKKKLTIISIVLIALIALCACSGDIETRDATPEDEKILLVTTSALYKIAYEKNPDYVDYDPNETTGIMTGSYKIKKDYTISDSDDEYLTAYEIKTLVIKAGSSMSVSGSEKDSGTITSKINAVIDDVSHSLEVKNSVDSEGNNVFDSVVIDNVLINNLEL